MMMTALPVQTDSELGRELALTMNSWLTSASPNPTNTVEGLGDGRWPAADLIEWCRSARDVLVRLAGNSDGGSLAPDCGDDCGCHGTGSE